MESAVHASVPLRVGKKMRKRRELDALVGGGGVRSGRLLSASSDEGEPWARRSTRRRRSRPFVRLAAGLALCVCVVSAATVLWLFVDVRRQIVSLRIEMDRVSTSSESVGDTIQLCHTRLKELTTNTSEMSQRIAKLEQDHMELVRRVDEASKELSEVSNQLSAAPKLADTPRRLTELQRLVADFGSQINGFDGVLTSTKKQATTAVSGVEEIKTLVHQLEARTNETIANLTANVKRDEDIKNEIASLNSSLVSKMDTLQARIQEINKPVTTMAPMTPVPDITNNTSINTTISSTLAPIQPPGPPAKPSILQS